MSGGLFMICFSLLMFVISNNEMLNFECLMLSYKLWELMFCVKVNELNKVIKIEN